MTLEPDRLEKMFQLIGEDSATLIDIINSYLEETPAFVARLRNATLNESVKEAGTAAHALCSTSLDMGALTFSNMCRDIEEGCRARATLPSATQLKQLEGELVRVVEELREVIPAINNGSWLNAS